MEGDGGKVAKFAHCAIVCTDNTTRPSMGNYLARAQRWSNATQLPAGKRVRIRLEAVQAKLFSFSFGAAAV